MTHRTPALSAKPPTSLRFRPILRALIVTLVIAAFCVPAQPDAASADPSLPWAQWRGPDGLGVSAESDLPTTWSVDSPSIRWFAEIPGEGFSSPAVGNNQVVLTTAYQNPDQNWSKRVARIAAAIVGGLLVLTLGWALVRLRPTWPLPALISQGTLVLLFTSLALLVLLTPLWFDALLTWIRPAFAFVKSRDLDGLFSIQDGSQAAIWLLPGCIALLGLATCCGWWPRASGWRYLTGLLVLGLGAWLYNTVPLSLYGWKVTTSERLVFLGPVLLVTFGYLASLFEATLLAYPPDTPKEDIPRGLVVSKGKALRIRLRIRHWRLGGGTGFGPMIFTVVLAMLVFVAPNFVFPNLGLQRAVICLDQATGEQRWIRTAFVTPPERKHTDNSYATPTPVMDHEHIVVNYGLGLACLTLDGTVVWTHSDPTYLDQVRYGAAISPLLLEDTVILLQDGEESTQRPTWLGAFDKASGDVRWKISPSFRGGYATPLLRPDDAGTQIVVNTLHNVVSFAADDGTVLWQAQLPMEQIVASMAGDQTRICVGGSTWGPDGLVMLRTPRRRQDLPEVLWHVEDYGAEDSSPVLYMDLLFATSDRGKMRCYNAESGALHWEQKLPGRYLASLAAGDGKIYATNTRGLTTVIAAAPRFEILAQNALRDTAHASMAIADGHLFIRAGTKLYCIGPG